MRILLLVIWMLIPIGGLAYHLGPGQTDIKQDQASQALHLAEHYVANKKWSAAQQQYEVALELLPEESKATNQRARLEKSKVQMLNGQLALAEVDLETLLSELIDEGDDADQELLTETRTAYANSKYYITWLMRLEGRPRAEWEPESENAQQTYRLLAEQAAASGDETETRLHDLESAVRLARMDIGELQALPLPNQ